MATGSSLTLANPMVRRKSESTLPPFFREWVSVAEESRHGEAGVAKTQTP